MSVPIIAGIVNNSSTPSQKSDYGIVISQPGYNAGTTSSQNQIFNSSWPSLQEAFARSIPVGTTQVAHGLKFTPFSVYYSVANSGSLPSFTSLGFNVANVDATNIYIPSSTSATYVVGYNIDLTKDIDYPTLQGTNVKLNYDPDYGIKVVKSGKLISSTDLRDYILHSRCQSALVLAVKTQATTKSTPTIAGGGGAIQYTSTLGYPSWNFGFVKSSVGLYRYAPFYQQAYPITFTDDVTTYIEWQTVAGDVGATLVILRNPLFAKTFTVATY